MKERDPLLKTEEAPDSSQDEALNPTLIRVERADATENAPVVPGARIMRKLGKGGMGEIYLAAVEDMEQFREASGGLFLSLTADEASLQQEIVTRNLEYLIAAERREIAVKVMPGASAGNREARKFTRMASRVPDAPRAYGGTALNDEKLLLFMETEPGMDLSALMRTQLRKPFPVRAANDIAALTARGLYAAHKEGVMHRDVKPENIYVTDSGRILILDLGLAKSSDSGNSTQTLQGTVSGTLRYMAPEQARGERVTPKCDVFALGKLLTEMYTGYEPYAVSGTGAVSSLMTRANLERGASVVLHPDETNPRLAEYQQELKRLLKRMIDPQPGMRPDMEEVARFFHDNSSFGSSSFDDEFTSQEQRGNFRLHIAPAKERETRDGYSTYLPEEMLIKIEAGATESAEASYDFLAQYTPTGTIPPVVRSRVRTVLMLGGALTVSALGGVIAWNTLRTSEQSESGVPGAPVTQKSLPSDAPKSDAPSSLPTNHVQASFVPEKEKPLALTCADDVHFQKADTSGATLPNYSGFPVAQLQNFTNGSVFWQNNEFRGFVIGEGEQAVFHLTLMHYSGKTHDGETVLFTTKTFSKEDLQKMTETVLQLRPDEQLPEESQEAFAAIFPDKSALITLPLGRYLFLKPTGESYVFPDQESMERHPEASAAALKILGSQLDTYIAPKVLEPTGLKMGMHYCVDGLTKRLAPNSAGVRHIGAK